MYGSDSMVSEIVEAIYQNALRLLADAQLLYDKERFESATALSVLSMEEAGKACLVRWKEEGRLQGDLGAHVRQSHFHKQRIFLLFSLGEGNIIKYCQLLRRRKSGAKV